MLLKLLIYLGIAPLSIALAECPCYSALSSAIEGGAPEVIDYGGTIPHGQVPICTRPQQLRWPDKPVEANGTIYKFLANNPKFTLVTKALNYEKKVAALLNDSSAHLTFFAPPDDVLRRPKHHHSQELDWSTLDGLSDSMTDPFHLMDFGDLGRALDFLDTVDKPDLPGDPKKREKIIKFILHAILSYHIIPAGLGIEKLGLNNTFPTHLEFPHIFDNQPLRLRVQQLIFPPITSLNFYSKIFHANISATNGFVHVINHPLIPPPPVFQILYLFSDHFSTLTSAIQRSGLTDLLDLRFSHEKGLEGEQVVTVFAPTNRAFQRLPRKLNFFLFSPFGAKVLKKLLQYHIVPDLAFFSDYIHHKRVKEEFECANFEKLTEADTTGGQLAQSWLSKPRRSGPIIEPISHLNYTLNTAFINHTLDVVVDRNKITLPLPGHHKPSMIDTKICVNKRVAHVRDVVGLNGAIHVVDKLLDPRKHGHNDDEEESWEDWEEWLPKWGEA